MKRTPKNTETAAQAYRRNREAIDALMAKIAEGLEGYDEYAASGRGIDYGNVGDVADMKATLQAMSDQLYNEGEYAPENIAGSSERATRRAQQAIATKTSYIKK